MRTHESHYVFFNKIVTLREDEEEEEGFFFLHYHDSIFRISDELICFPSRLGEMGREGGDAVRMRARARKLTHLTHLRAANKKKNRFLYILYLHCTRPFQERIS